MTQSFWPEDGYAALVRNDRGWLRATPDYWRHWLARPELAPMAESSEAECALHARLIEQPLSAVAAHTLDALDDADTAENYRHFLAFRDRVTDAVTLERFYLQLFRGAAAGRAIDLPPQFIDGVCQAIVHATIDGCENPWTVRAAELLFRAQRVALENGQWLSADAESIQGFAETGGFGALGRLMTQQGTALRTQRLDVLSHENAPLFWLSADRFAWILDLTPGRPGLAALCDVQARWVRHFFGHVVRIEPLTAIEDAHWRWHTGLDVESTAILNDLYEGRDVDETRRSRLVSLFKLTFGDAEAMRADVRGVPVYLGLAVTEQRELKVKPQNLLLNLPLATAN
ncbi:MAG: hypothetical protein JNJ55_08105 [Betaproteobacteria bacterium]|nr:hypothetical protein [Betaproteobacteria bacterium]